MAIRRDMALSISTACGSAVDKPRLRVQVDVSRDAVALSKPCVNMRARGRRAVAESRDAVRLYRRAQLETVANARDARWH